MRFAKAYVEITNVCNRSCDFCPKTRRTPAFLSCEDFLSICQKLRPYTDYLYFHVMGEPLLHPQLGDLLSIAGQLGFRVILTTNGTLLADTAQILLAADALHKVNVSLHSFEANECGGFDRYLERCIAFAAAAAAGGVLINFRLWNLDGSQTSGKHEKNETILKTLASAFPEPWQQARGGMRLGERVYLSYGEKFLWPSLEAAERDDVRFCYGLKDQLGVLVDGTVIPCCLDHEGDLALGNLLHASLEEILQRPRTRAIVEGFRQNCPTEVLCRRCGYASRFQKAR